jgi:hypothetical protein
MKIRFSLQAKRLDAEEQERDAKGRFGSGGGGTSKSVSDFSDSEKEAIQSVVDGTAESINEESWSPPPPPGMSTEELEEESDFIFANASEDQLEAFGTYTENSTIVNNLLRGKNVGSEAEIEAARKQVDAIDDVFADANLSDGVVAYRGMSLSSLEQQGVSLTPGTTFSDPAYLSTSAEEAVADRLFGSGGDDSALMEIAVPAGARALYLENISQIPGESELLLDRGQSIRIISVSEETVTRGSKSITRKRIRAELVRE